MPLLRLAGPAAAGALLALAAALLFGVSTPLVQRFGVGLGPFETAALLYAGAAALGAALRRPPTREAALRRDDWPRLVAVAAFGAVAGPVALAWGLQRTGAAAASLMLTLEVVATALAARLLYGEALDRPTATAVALLTVGGAVLVAGPGGLGGGGAPALGLLAVGVATVAWGLDNAVSRALAERDPGQVVMVKAALGAVATGLLVFALGEPAPTLPAASALLAVGATGYGLSLRLYLLAQRRFGATRTGSVFAFAPFVGALAAWAMGDRTAGWGVAAAAPLMLAGIALHLAETHDHPHDHEALEHEHAHRHDDGHHAHRHAPMPAGAHSHPHRHAPQRHAHPHAPDIHHPHRH